MQILAQLIVSGIAVGMIYGVIAFGYQLTFATSKTLNFGQGEALMLGSLVGLHASSAYHRLLARCCRSCSPSACCRARWSSGWACARRSRPNPKSGWIMATIALGIIFRNLAENIWGRDALKFPSPLPEAPLAFARRQRAADGDRHRRRRARA